MSIAQFMKDHTCSIHFSDISSGAVPPVEGKCLICENEQLRRRLEPFLGQEAENNAFLRSKSSVEADQNKRAALEAKQAGRTYQESAAGSVEATPIIPPSPVEPNIEGMPGVVPNTSNTE